MFGLKQRNADPRVKRQLEQLGIRYDVDRDGDYRVVFELEGDRSQLAFINSRTSALGDFEIREIWSVAHVTEEPLDAAMANFLLLQNARLKIGAWELRHVDEGTFYVCFCTKVAADCEAAALYASLVVVLKAADELEKELDTGDRF